MELIRASLVLLFVGAVSAYLECPDGYHAAGFFDSNISEDPIALEGSADTWGSFYENSWGSVLGSSGGSCAAELEWHSNWFENAETVLFQLEMVAVGSWTGETPFVELPQGLCQETLQMWYGAKGPEGYWATTIGVNNTAQCFPEAAYCSSTSHGADLPDFETTLPNDGGEGAVFNVTLTASKTTSGGNSKYLIVEASKNVGSCANPAESCSTEYIAFQRATACLPTATSPIVISSSASSMTVNNDTRATHTLDGFDLTIANVADEASMLNISMGFEGADPSWFPSSVVPFVVHNDPVVSYEWEGLADITFPEAAQVTLVINVTLTPGYPWPTYFETASFTIYVDDPNDNCTAEGICSSFVSGDGTGGISDDGSDDGSVTSIVCELPMFLCPENATLCVSTPVECSQISEAGGENNTAISDECESGLSLCWATGECLSDLSSGCDTVPGCNEDEFPLRCWDGSCLAANETCPDVPDCPADGQELCGDGVCRDVSEQACPATDACGIDEPFRCASGACAPGVNDCGDEVCAHSAVLCWDESCAPNRANCTDPPFFKRVQEAVLDPSLGAQSLNMTDGTDVVMVLTINECQLDPDAGLLYNTRMHIDAPPFSLFSQAEVRSGVVGASLLNATTNSTLEGLGVGNMLASLQVRFSASLKPAEHLVDTCLAGLDPETGEWECILNYEDYAGLLEVASEDPCDPAVLLGASGVSARSEESGRRDPGRYTVFAQVVGRVNEALDEEDGGIVIVATVASILVVLFLLTLWVGFCFLLRSSKEVRPPPLENDSRMANTLNAARSLKKVFKNPESASWAALPAWSPTPSSPVARAAAQPPRVKVQRKTTDLRMLALTRPGTPGSPSSSGSTSPSSSTGRPSSLPSMQR